MPRYRYKCSECQTEATIFHLYNEVVSECLACRARDTMEKLLTTPQYKNKSQNGPRKTGEVTKEYIELNREILETEKKQRKDYEPT
jgi:predicted nucleic acid-binding Zn ribbon protein